MALVDNSGTVANRYSYDPFGNVISVSEQVSNPIRYLGQLQDSATGLYHFGERYYDPTLARFRQAGPGGSCDTSDASDQVTNRYAYAGDNPVSYIDPEGLSRHERSQGHRKIKRLPGPKAPRPRCTIEDMITEGQGGERSQSARRLARGRHRALLPPQGARTRASGSSRTSPCKSWPTIQQAQTG